MMDFLHKQVGECLKEHEQKHSSLVCNTEVICKHAQIMLAIIYP